MQPARRTSVTRRQFLAASCAWPSVLAAMPAEGQHTPSVTSAHVLLVQNQSSEDSIAVARYYAARRKVPAVNVCSIRCPADETCSADEYQAQIERPIRAFLNSQKQRIDFVVLTRDIPSRISGGALAGLSVDGLISTIEIKNLRPRTFNPYFNREERFSHDRYAIYLVTRLDGYTRQDCFRLVDRSVAATPAKGPFLLHTGPGHTQNGYRMVNDGMRRAHDLLKARGMTSILSTSDTFPGNVATLMGYFSWGSNDQRFDLTAYRSLRFLPGAIAETAVSTSGRTFHNPKEPGQSLIADLIAQGVTGCKGYVSEPYVDAIAMADILFPRYAAGYTLAESFYMASRFIRWKDVVIGDPLCAPYSQTSKPKTARLPASAHR